MSDPHRPDTLGPPAQNRSEIAELQSRLIANAARLFSSTTIASLIGIVSFVLTARTLGPTEFGMLVLVFTFASAVIRLCGFQSWQAIIKFASEHREAGAADRVAAIFRFGFLLDFGACLIGAAVAYTGSAAAAELFAWDPKVEAAARLYAIAVLFSLTGTPTAALRLYNRFDLIAWQQVLAAVLKLALVVLVMIYAPTFEGFVYAWIVSHILTHLLLIGLSLGTLYANNSFDPAIRRGARMKDVVSGAVWRFVLITNVDGMVRTVRELDAQIVALIVDEAAAGLLRIARQIATFVGRFVDAFFVAIYPDLARIASEKRWPVFTRFVRRSAVQVGVFASVFLLAFIAIGEPALRYLFGAEYADAYEATCIFIGAMVVWGFTQPFSPGLMALGAVGRMLLNHVVAAGCYVALLLVLIPQMSYVGAAWAMVGLYCVWGALTLVTYTACVSRSMVATR